MTATMTARRAGRANQHERKQARIVRDLMTGAWRLRLNIDDDGLFETAKELVRFRGHGRMKWVPASDDLEAHWELDPRVVHAVTQELEALGLDVLVLTPGAETNEVYPYPEPGPNQLELPAASQMPHTGEPSDDGHTLRHPSEAPFHDQTRGAAYYANDPATQVVPKRLESYDAGTLELPDDTAASLAATGRRPVRSDDPYRNLSIRTETPFELVKSVADWWHRYINVVYAQDSDRRTRLHAEIRTSLEMIAADKGRAI